MSRTHKLKDTFEYKTVPFLVEVYDTDMFIHATSGEIRGINVHGAPTGMRRGTRKWKRCECRVAKVRPDYPYSIEREWPEDVDKHVSVVEPFEVPSKGVLFYGTEERNVDPDPQDMAKRVIEQLKQGYEDSEVQSLEADV